MCAYESESRSQSGTTYKGTTSQRLDLRAYRLDHDHKYGRSGTDLGFLLHKNPANLHSAELPFGKAYVFYSNAAERRCTACLLLELDPVDLVRGGQQLEEYVNDRPYVASSYLTVAMGRIFGTALAGNCQKRPELVDTKLPLEITVEVIRARGGADILHKLFDPLGYHVGAMPIPLDEKFADWGASPYFRLTLGAHTTIHDVLSHLYVLLPVLDDEKHYYIGDAEVDKLLRRGEGWLGNHPHRELIVQRYLKRKPSLIDRALTRLLDEENAAVDARESKTEQAALAEKDLERPMTLHTQRLNQVAAKLKALEAKSILDLGCGEGKLLRRLLADRTFERIVGMDVSHRSLEAAASRLRLDRLPERHRKRLELIQGSLLYRDKRLSGFDAAVLIEVIEHLDPPRLLALERVLFELARPRHIIITTPNREYNVLFPTLPPGRMRHNDHRFEWTRAEFSAWAENTAARFGYQVVFEPVGPVDSQHGAPSQMAVFSLPIGGAE
ncbi:MAG TPA: 3' terminal RNA ribose 2'-O-methyltransferase Hen1 [Bryobacteraceae bacterium]|nr:3' terminal RNA ribose 2'-O-methyltransferase Hen1 [Bryobacteraceae bacterium]